MEVIWGIRIADVNGDGRADLVVSSGGFAGRLGPGVGTSPQLAAQMPKQAELPVPHVAVWLNDSAAKPTSGVAMSTGK